MMKGFDVEKLIREGSILNELDYERAMRADRKLRLLSKEDVHFKNLRTKLRTIIEDYEKHHWDNINQIDYSQLIEETSAEEIAERERLFIEYRKSAIRIKLKEFSLTQENLALLLGHKSKTHMSELINGIKPFTLKDLVILHYLFKIELHILIPTFLSYNDLLRVEHTLKALLEPNEKQ